jgi:hypothetical protein
LVAKELYLKGSNSGCDGRRNQDQARRLRCGAVFLGVEGKVQGQGRPGRIAHDVDRLAGRTIGQAAIAPLVEGFAQRSQAIWRIRHAVEQKDAAHGIIGRELETSVPVGSPVLGIGGAAGAVADQGVGGPAPDDIVNLLIQFGEERVLQPQIVVEASNPIRLLRGEVQIKVFGMPRLQRRATAPEDQERRSERHEEQNGGNGEALHGRPPYRPRVRTQ